MRVLLAAAGLSLALSSTAALAADAENTLYLDLKNDCRVVIDLRPDLAPKHVARIKELARMGFYDGLTFHRVIDGFMVQGGDPIGNGTGGSGQKLPAEFSSEKHVRGVTSMARSSSPDSADSQFFIVLANSPHLDNNYTVWGKVVKGMEIVDKIKQGAANQNGTVQNPDRIVKLRVAADVKE